MRKTKFVALILAVAMVLAMSVNAFAATSSSGTSSSGTGTGGGGTISGGDVTRTSTGEVTAVDENGNELKVTAADIKNSSETMKTLVAAGSAEKLIVGQDQKLAAAVALSSQSAGLEDLRFALAKTVQVTASKTNPATVTLPVAAAEGKGSVVVMEKTSAGWTVVPATVADGQVTVVITEPGDIVVMVAPEGTEAPVEGAMDVAKGKWYNKFENFAIIADIVDVDDVRPEEVTTRGDYIKMLFNMAGKPAATKINNFTDMAGYEDFSNAINWAVESGIIAGYTDGTVRCGKQITRQEMVVMLYNFAKYDKTNITDTTDLSQYADVADVAFWAEYAVKWANARGIVVGTSANRLTPAGNSLRCQAVTTLYNYTVVQ